MNDESSMHEGVSEESFAAAAENAVADYEKEHGISQDLMRFKVEAMYVTAKHNPIHEYIVHLRRA